jgi:hypothetical protein
MESRIKSVYSDFYPALLFVNSYKGALLAIYFHVSSLFGLFLDTEDGVDMFFRKIG